MPSIVRDEGGVGLGENQRKAQTRFGPDAFSGALFTSHRLPSTMGKFRAYPTTQEFAQISNLNIQAPYSVDGMNRSSLTASNLNPPR